MKLVILEPYTVDEVIEDFEENALVLNADPNCDLKYLEAVDTFNKVLNMTRSYSLFNPERIEVIGNRNAVYIIDKEYEFYVEIEPDFKSSEEEMYSRIANVYRDYVDYSGAWIGDGILNGRITRNNVSEVLI